ncbi:ABC transporter ATP-binding protein [Saccharopolyspora sp. 5N708]|uniref:ABC transporter ATP-binding protein n=1 Tax=Saccharopolyspora sp. 5N708 TaxID=3457424 RepID=UPI003FCF8D47
MPDVRLSQVSKRFGDVSALDAVDLTIRDGEFFTMLGPSGCGKSTTLNCIAGLEEPTTGTITVGDVPFVDTERKFLVPPEERNLGMVFQSYALWPHMTVTQNLAVPLSIRKVRRQDRAKLIEDALDKVGLAHLGARYPHELSGGQQQRVALARALVYSPSVLLLDEPLSNLDAKLREQARAWLKRLQEDLGITTVYVTHDQDEALSLSDRIAVMFDGKMSQIGTPAEIYDRPVTAQVAGFVGSCNFLLGKVADRRPGVVEVRLQSADAVVEVASPDTFSTGQDVTVAIRPERLSIIPADGESPVANVLETDVLTRAYVGSRFEYDLRLGTSVVKVITQDGTLEGGVRLVFDRQDALLYPGVGVPSVDAQQLSTVA